MHQNKTIIISGLLVAIVLMTIGYAILATSLNINGSTAVTSNWQVEFSDIRTVEQKGGATNKITPTVSKTTANFEVDLVQPGDEITYEIDITNYGDIEAEVKGATYTSTGSEAIYVRFEGIRKGTRIASCEGESSCPKVTVIVKVGYDASITSDPEEKTKDISITLDIGQYVSSNPTPDEELIPELTIYTLPEKILNDNKIQSDTNIDFSKTSEEDGTKGLYYTRINTEGNRPTYYFRGAVENNYVSFAGFYWRIIRINEDGSVRLIYQGIEPDAMEESAAIYSSAFNTQGNDNTYVGYMYGTEASSSYETTHDNLNNSSVKEYLDSWYRRVLIDSSYLADSGFCGDRSITSGTGIGTVSTIYEAWNRYYTNQSPQFACPQENDLYTISTSNKGNHSLSYPVGLITTDEVMYAGGTATKSNETYYLYTGAAYWTMSPTAFSGSANVSYVNANGSITGYYVSTSNDIRPVINLKSSVLVSSGDGTQDNPYIIAE